MVKDRSSCRWVHISTRLKGLPCRQIEAGSEAAENVEGGSGPDTLDALLDSLDHANAHVVLLLGGRDPLVKVVNLLVQAEKICPS